MTALHFEQKAFMVDLQFSLLADDSRLQSNLLAYRGPDRISTGTVSGTGRSRKRLLVPVGWGLGLGPWLRLCMS